jgi:GAF domain
VLVGICVLAALVEIASIVDATGMGGAPPWRGSLGINTATGSKPFDLAIASVDRGEAADVAGLRRDDLIDIRANSLVERNSLFGVPLNGLPLLLSVQRGQSQLKVTVAPQGPALTWNFWLGAFTDFWLLLFATLIAYRGAGIPHMRLLSMWLAVFVLTGALLGCAVPWAWVYVLLNVAVSVLGPLSVALLAAFASGFARPLSRLRRTSQWLCYIFLAIFTIVSLVGIAGNVTLWFDPVPFVVGFRGIVPISAAVLMAVLCGILAITASRGLERQRAVWTLVPLAAFYCFFIVGVIALTSSSFADSIVIGLASTVVLLGTPVALTYAALSRRLIDIGFFLNRAAVFAIISVIVVGVFVLFEWAAGRWLEGVTHTTSAIVGMIVALALGLSMAFIQKYVERLVDVVFFRKRHDDEAALRRFAHEASYVSDRSTLLERAVRTVIEHTGAEDAAILVRRDPDSYAWATGDQRAEVSEDDPVIVALRTWRKPIDLHEVHDSQLRGEFALPMTSRGDLVGALICGPKRDGESYAPDELEALSVLAHGVGLALSTDRDGAVGLIVTELAELRDEMKRTREFLIAGGFHYPMDASPIVPPK